MTKQMNIESTTVDLIQVMGDIYVTRHPSHGNLMVEVAQGFEEDEIGGEIIATPVERALFAVPLPEWEEWAHNKWGPAALQEAKRLLWMTP